MSNEIPSYQYKKDPTTDLNNAWWTSDKNGAHGHIFAKVSAIKKHQSSRRVDWLRFARLYTNTDFDQFVSGVISAQLGRRLSFNVCRSCVDTACAKISKAKPRPYFLTEGGNFTQKKKAKKLTQYSDGMFSSLRLWQVGRRAFRDACIFGTGALKYFTEHGKAKVERVFIDEIVVDELDGRNMEPREIHQTKIISKEVLIGLFPDFKSEISAASLSWDKNQVKRSTTDMIGVIESWHLKSGPEAKDGRHVICIDNCTLLDEPYEKDYFPFTFIRWNEPVLGFYGEGLVAQLVGIQLEINTVLLRIKEGLELVAVPRILVEESSGVQTSQITDEVGGIVKYRGTKPDFISPVAFGKETYEFLEYLYRKGFEDTGISQLSAMSKKPAGLDSRVALREYQDIETERFALIAENYQTMFLDGAKILIDLQRELQENGESPSISAKVPNKDFIETIKWKDVDLDADKFIMQAYPTNLLPRTPEGQLEFTQELIQSGFLDKEQAMSLLDYPDIKRFFNLTTAAMDDIEEILERIIEEQQYTPPEPYMNLQLAMKMAQSAYLRAKTDGTSEQSQELLRRFVDECEEIVRMSTLPPPGMAPVGATSQAQPGAIAQPEPAPVSDLLPINGVQ